MTNLIDDKNKVNWLEDDVESIHTGYESYVSVNNIKEREECVELISIYRYYVSDDKFIDQLIKLIRCGKLDKCISTLIEDIKINETLENLYEFYNKTDDTDICIIVGDYVYMYNALKEYNASKGV